MEIVFWGVRGSTPCASSVFQVYGGHTSCVSVYVDGQFLVFDAGSGMIDIGPYLGQQNITNIHLFLSHVHLDHILGLPFFASIWKPSHTIDIYAGHLTELGGIKKVLQRVLTPPIFPVPLEKFPANIRYQDLLPQESIALSNQVLVKTFVLNHPNKATGYRVEFKNKSVCYITDNEHTPGKLDLGLVEFIKKADLVIYDSTYTDAEYPSHINWGHSTWEEGIRLCQAAEVKSYAVFHHDPSHNDSCMQEIEQKVKQIWEKAFVARQGMKITL